MIVTAAVNIPLVGTPLSILVMLTGLGACAMQLWRRPFRHEPI